VTLAELNQLSPTAFADQLGAVFEHSPWVAGRAQPRRPFRSVDELHAAMMDAVRSASPEQQLTLIRAHPELAGAEAKEGTLTEHSTGEQARLGLNALSAEELSRMADLNRRYRDRFGFPCIIALRQHGSRASVLKEMERRSARSRDEELRAALEQIGHIAKGRLDKMFGTS
jgi:2-oxo-4-hydroxy-4-carboxy-5-ureidoimidazoline decarboxylase